MVASQKQSGLPTLFDDGIPSSEAVERSVNTQLTDDSTPENSANDAAGLGGCNEENGRDLSREAEKFGNAGPTANKTQVISRGEEVSTANGEPVSFNPAEGSADMANNDTHVSQSRVEAPFPGPEMAKNAFGERLSRYLIKQRITPDDISTVFSENCASPCIWSYVMGLMVPGDYELPVFAKAFDESVDTLFCERYLPSSALRQHANFQRAIKAIGLVCNTPAEAVRSNSIRITLGDFFAEEWAPLPQVVACEVETGLLADLGKKNRSLSLYTVPTNDESPEFVVGDTAVVDTTRFREKAELTWQEIGMSGYYLVDLGGQPTIRYLSFRFDMIRAYHHEGRCYDLLDRIRVLGSIVARIKVTAI